MNAKDTMVWIDGSYGEGGGQIIRTSVSLAVLTGRAVDIVNIRARRSRPGLQAQHLTAVLAAAALCEAKLEGAELNSTHLRFTPGPSTTQETFAFDVALARNGASAGAASLVAQTLITPMSYLPVARVEAIVQGGTHVPMSPPADYLEAVYLPMLRRIGLHADLVTPRAGFFPKGGGEIRLSVISGCPNFPLQCEKRGRLHKLRAFTVTSGLPSHVAERAARTLDCSLKGYGVPVEITTRDLPSTGQGAAILLAAECENSTGGWTALGERGKPIEQVVEEVTRQFQSWHMTNTAVDSHMADQLALPCALMPVQSRWTTPELTSHLRTVLWIIEQFLPIHYRLEKRTDGSGLVILEGTSL